MDNRQARKSADRYRDERRGERYEEYEEQDEEIERRRRERRRRQMEEMRRRKRRQRQIRRILRIALPAAGALLLFFLIRGCAKKETEGMPKPANIVENGAADIESIDGTTTENGAVDPGATSSENIANRNPGIGVTVPGVIGSIIAENKVAGSAASSKDGDAVYTAEATAETAPPVGTVNSSYVILIDVEEGKILAERASKSRMVPASMTKVLTLLVAAEHVTDLNDTFTIIQDITDFCFVNDCSNVGFEKDETVTVRDLLYGTILPSGADAAMGLATYVAGSQEAFVEMMNDKLRELGLSDTAHFTNCVGLYEENHYCTVYDMAMIMKAAMDNELCREVLSAHTYTTSATEQHPEGLLISNWFLRKIEDKDAGGEVIGGKTGYVVQSQNCAVSLARDADGKEYICVTGGANSGWRCIYDHVDLYKKYLGSSETQNPA